MIKPLFSKQHLYYERNGKGPDILMIHGWASSNRTWQSAVERFSDRYTLWTVDLPGFGRSPLPPNSTPNVEYFTETLLNFCHEVNLRPRAIIGHSMGGLLTLKLAIAAPTLTDGLMVLAPPVSGRIGVLGVGRLFATEFIRLAAARSSELWEIAKEDALANVVTSPWTYNVDERATDIIVGDFRRATWEAAYWSIVSMVEEDITESLPAIQQETLVVIGSIDTTVRPDEGRLAARLIPNARLVEFIGANHMPHEEQQQHFLDVMDGFLKRVV